MYFLWNVSSNENACILLDNDNVQCTMKEESKGEESILF